MDSECILKGRCAMARRPTEEVKEQRLYDEKKLAASIGVRRRFVCRWRETLGERERHWKAVDGQVAITDDGIASLALSLGMEIKKAALTDATLEKNGRVTVAVYYKPPNRNKLLVRRVDNKKFPEHVQVRDSSLFRIGDTFEAIEAKDGNGLVFYGRWPEAGW